MKLFLWFGLAVLAGRTLWADPGPAYNPAPDPHPAALSPAPTMVPFGDPAPAPYPSLDPLAGVTPTAHGPTGPLIPPSHEWEQLPTQVLALSSHGSVLGPSYERTLGHWFSAQGFVGLHSDSRYNAVSEGVSLRAYPGGHAPRGLYLEGQDDFIQESSPPPSAGVYQAQRIGVALGWQWLMRGGLSVSLAGALYQEQSLYATYADPAIGSNHDGSPSQVQAALDLSLGWDL
ncbi:MAG TPA: hypothetical protein VNZ54_00090 [bacterium]|jgi:hypothetical protein|nr:hypothetical protein [bacterium]HXC65207.1 hypothetical protein [bacterium]